MPRPCSSGGGGGGDEQPWGSCGQEYTHTCAGAKFVVMLFHFGSIILQRSPSPTCGLCSSAGRQSHVTLIQSSSLVLHPPPPLARSNDRAKPGPQTRSKLQCLRRCSHQHVSLCRRVCCSCSWRTEKWRAVAKAQQASVNCSTCDSEGLSSGSGNEKKGRTSCSLSASNPLAYRCHRCSQRGLKLVLK